MSQALNDAGAGLGATKAPLREARHVSGNLYTDPEILRQEKECFFMRDWLCVGRVEEIALPGDYLTFDVLGEPIIVARNAEGVLRAFSNVCAHRGVAVASGQGNKKMFSCPYHGWVYDLDGHLKSAPHMEESSGFALEHCRLQPLRVDDWQGWVFVCFDDLGQDLPSFLGSVRDRLAFIHAEDCRLGNKWEFELQCNWKTVVENFQDVYHLRVLHADTFGSAVDVDNYQPELLENGKFYSEFDGGVMTPDGESRFGGLPCWDGQPATSAAIAHINPNIMFFCRWDSVFMWNAWPVNADRTKIIFLTTFHKDHFDDPELQAKLEVYADFEKLVAQEDNEMVQSLQKGFRSRAYKPGRMSIYEHTIHHMINYQIKVLLGA